MLSFPMFLELKKKKNTPAKISPRKYLSHLAKPIQSSRQVFFYFFPFCFDVQNAGSPLILPHTKGRLKQSSLFTYSKHRKC